MMVKVAATQDMIQQASPANLTEPEIRVWCHPPLINQRGSDYYETFGSFKEARTFIETHKEAEQVPLVAIQGYELNLFAEMEEEEVK